MQTDTTRLNAAIAATRFGMGARPGELERIGRDARGWLEAQIRSGGAPQPEGQFVTSERRADQFSDYQRIANDGGNRPRALPQAAPAGQVDATAEAEEMARRESRRALTEETAREFLARAQLGATTDAGFAERWALFWANLFTASATKFQSAVFLGQYEREAIRPFVFGSFAELALAAESHPAMLLYLDQAQSVGPGSPLGQRRNAGLNENLAREILELHTVGSEAGYSQNDVTEFAKALTGWSIPRPRDDRLGPRAQALLAGDRGPRGFVFRQVQHEPGVRTVLGKTYGQTGVDQGEAILRDLAAHPATARRLARRIAVHFVADAPPAALVQTLERAWTRSRGDLGQVARALIAAPEAWDPAPAKVKTPYDFLISTHRAFGYPPQQVNAVYPALVAMGQPAWAAPSPEGWPDTAMDWAGPDALVKRLNWAKAVGDRVGDRFDASDIAMGALGPRLGERTRMAVARAESRAEALTLLLMSPEFQRR